MMGNKFQPKLLTKIKTNETDKTNLQHYYRFSIPCTK